MTQPDDIFLQYGQASYYIQCIEMDLVSFYLLDAIHTGKAIVREDMEKLESEWDEKTLGRLISPIKNSPLISDEIKNFFEDIRQKRNHLTHYFFKQMPNHFLSESGRIKMLNKLNEMTMLFQRCNDYLKKILVDYSKEVGIKEKQIRQEMAKLGIPPSKQRKRGRS